MSLTITGSAECLDCNKLDTYRRKKFSINYTHTFLERSCIVKKYFSFIIRVTYLVDCNMFVQPVCS